MLLSIIIPVLNEERTIAEILRRVHEQPLLPPWEKEIIVVDDGSRDNSKSKVQNAKSQFKIQDLKLIEHDKNKGKGEAIKSGLAAATGDAIIIQDADLEYSPGEFPALLRELEQHPEAAAIFGSRNIAPKHHGYTHYVWGVALLTAAINILYRANLTDAYTCYKLFRANIIKSIPLQSRGFEFEAEVCCKLLRSGHKIREIAIDYFPRTFAEGKKIRFKDGVKGVWSILKYQFTN